LKQALTHQSSKAQTYYIPTPEAAQASSGYETLYGTDFKPLKTYAKCANDDPLQAVPKYSADLADETFIGELRKAGAVASKFDLTLYEWMVDCLEDAAHKFSENIVSSESIERLRDKFSALLPDEATINKMIDYWRERRIQERRIVPRLRHEDLGKIGSDPYVCFRRRELKLPRKTRRSDAQITDRLKKLHLDLSSMRLMLQSTVKRDRYKREALVLEGELFEKYRLVDNWRKHHKSEWPPQLVTFKTAAQSLLEPKKKKNRVEGEFMEGINGGYKIAIPVAALKSSRHGKPYYPHEIGRLIQKDMDLLLGHGGNQDYLVDDFCPDFRDLTGQNYHASSWMHGRPVSYRRGRGGRLIVDRPHSSRSQTRPLQDLSDPAIIKFHSTLLSAKDFTQLQTPLGNYNVHAVQTANQILRPMSYQAWVASTAPILTAITGKARSPKKKREEGAQITVRVKSQPKEAARRGTGARFTPHGLAPESNDDGK
jgi:hypothetical protein